MAAPHPAINAPGLPSCDIARVALFANQECGTSRDTAFLRRCLRDCVTNPRRSAYRYDSVPRTSGASTNHASAPQNLSPDSRGYPIASLLRPTFTSAEDQHGLHPPSGYMLCFTHRLKDAHPKHWRLATYLGILRHLGCAPLHHTSLPAFDLTHSALWAVHYWAFTWAFCGTSAA